MTGVNKIVSGENLKEELISLFTSLDREISNKYMNECGDGVSHAAICIQAVEDVLYPHIIGLEKDQCHELLQNMVCIDEVLAQVFANETGAVEIKKIVYFLIPKFVSMRLMEIDSGEGDETKETGSLQKSVNRGLAAAGEVGGDEEKVVLPVN